jgi:hypothetical protein
MASGGYYGGNHAYGGNNAQQPYYDPQYVPSPQPTPEPSYHTTQPGYGQSYPSGGAYGGHANPPARPGVSPFDTVFDDNVYPAASQPNLAASSTNDVSKHAYYGNTGYNNYYGQAGGPGVSPASSRPNMPEDIPLQDRTGKSSDVNDHIYDANGAQPPRPHKSHRGKVRIGELGMFGSDKKRIPFVVYIFTLAQVAVFIGEIVKNGKCHSSKSAC